MDLHLSIKEIFTAFMVLFAVIDITGSTPIIINLNATGKQVQAGKAALISYAVMITFLFAGDALLQLFNVDISSFAIAGALVLNQLRSLFSHLEHSLFWQRFLHYRTNSKSVQPNVALIQVILIAAEAVQPVAIPCVREKGGNGL